MSVKVRNGCQPELSSLLKLGINWVEKVHCGKLRHGQVVRRLSLHGAGLGSNLAPITVRICLWWS